MQQIVAQVEGWAAEFDRLCERIGPRFARPEVRRRVVGFLRGLLGNVPRKNGSSVVKRSVFGQVAAVCCDRCWSATRQR